MTLIEEEPNGAKIYYARTSLPMMSDRDAYYRVHFEEQQDGTILYTASSVDRPDFPEKKGVIRQYIFKVGKMF